MLVLYLSWYGTALALLLTTIWLARRWPVPWRIVAITGVAALGFTTVPLFRDGGGAWYPVGVYYLSFGRSWLEAAAGATKVIVFVWVVLAGSILAFYFVFRKLRSVLRPPDR
jgi:hypothetical protein